MLSIDQLKILMKRTLKEAPPEELSNYFDRVHVDTKKGEAVYEWRINAFGYPFIRDINPLLGIRP